MFVFVYPENCTVPTEAPSGPNSSLPSQSLLHAIFIPLFSVALCTNTLALVVLNRPVVRHRFGSIRLHLTLLSSSEVCLNSFLMAQMIFHLSMASSTSSILAKKVLDTIAEWNVGALLTSRNWCVALIALARCEAIWKPLGWRGQRKFYFNPKRVLRYYVTIVLLSYAWSLLRRFRFYGEVCAGYVTRMQLLDASPQFKNFDRYGYFATQRAAPTVVIFGAAVAILCILLRTHSPQSHVGAGGGVSSRSQSRKAARMVAILAVVFTVLEMPIFLTITLMYAGVKMDTKTATEYLGIVNVCCIVADSICNFLIYIFTSKRFKQEAVRLLRHCGRKRQPRYLASGPVSSPEFV